MMPSAVFSHVLELVGASPCCGVWAVVWYSSVARIPRRMCAVVLDDCAAGCGEIFELGYWGACLWGVVCFWDCVLHWLRIC